MAIAKNAWKNISTLNQAHATIVVAAVITITNKTPACISKIKTQYYIIAEDNFLLVLLMGPLFFESKSKVFQANKKTASLKVTIPEDIVDFMKLKPKDTLSWLVRIEEGNKIVTFVRKASENP